MTSQDSQLRDVKRLAQGVATKTTTEAIVDLTLAVNILIGLVEGHRHTYDGHFGETTTGPMQAREER